jgi:hypothetical protein
MTGTHPTITAAVAREHVNDLRRAAEHRAQTQQRVRQLPVRRRPRTPRQLPAWWRRSTAPAA